MSANFSGKRSAMRVASVLKSAVPLSPYVLTSFATAPTRLWNASASNSGESNDTPSEKLLSNAQNAGPASFGLRANTTLPCVSTSPKCLRRTGRYAEVFALRW